MNSKLWWYAARSNGLVAWALLAASVLWGLALSTKVFRKHPRPAWLLDLHRFLGAAALVFTVVHVSTIMADTYVHFGIVEVLVPFTGSWHPAAVAWGIAGLYLLAAIELTSLLRRRLPKRLWRTTHYASFPLFALTTVHALWAGTDRHTVLMRAGILGATAAVIVLTFIRTIKAEHHDLLRSPPQASSGPAQPTAWMGSIGGEAAR
jgi:DMSO/TMAO reductase YedYZ heme-binding membrane subunit